MIDSRVAASPKQLRCFKCGYSLLGLADKGECPECAYPIRRSLYYAQRGDGYARRANITLLGLGGAYVVLDVVGIGLTISVDPTWFLDLEYLFFMALFLPTTTLGILLVVGTRVRFRWWAALTTALLILGTAAFNCWVVFSAWASI